MGVEAVKDLLLRGGGRGLEGERERGALTQAGARNLERDPETGLQGRHDDDAGRERTRTTLVQAEGPRHLRGRVLADDPESSVELLGVELTADELA
jgi:hypothetical protein